MNFKEISSRTSGLRSLHIQIGNSWILDPDHIPLKDLPLLSALMEILNKRKIKVSSQPNMLRWRYRLACYFTLKESYHLAAHHSNIQDDDI